MANVVYLESLWVSWSLVTISPSLELISPATEAPGHSTALQPTVSVAWAATLPPLRPRLLKWRQETAALLAPLPPRQFSWSQSVLNTTRSKMYQVYGDIKSP